MAPTSSPVLTHAPGLIELTGPTVRVLEALRAAGGRPYLVGGCVRDAVRHPGLVPKDIDIEVFDLPIERVAVALAGLGRLDTVGQAFSVLKLAAGGEDFDITVPRREVKTGSGHTGFDVVPDPGASFEQASARRDFTLNALLFDPATEQIIDSWGGLEDLHAGVLRHVSDAFAEDPLRVLRAAGFAARFGFTLAPQTAALCRALAPTYAELPAERVWGEWSKIASRGTHISAALGVLVQTEWLAHFPELAATRGVQQDPGWHPEGDVFTHVGLAADEAAVLADEAGLTGEDRAVVVLAALAHDFGKVTHTQLRNLGEGKVRITSHGHDDAGVEPTLTFLARIGAPKAFGSRVAPLVREHMSSTGARPTKQNVRRLARRLAPATMLEWALVLEGDRRGRGTASSAGQSDPWMAVARELGTEEAPRSRIVTGDHLIAMGHKPGRHFGPVLDAALAAQDGGEFDDEAGGLTWMQAHLEANPEWALTTALR